MSQPLNTPLHEVLQRFDGGVRVSNTGQEQIVRTRPDPNRPSRVLTEAIQRGEQYQVRCPFCSDRHQHLYLSYQYGQPDARTGRSNYHLWFCQRANCHKNPTNRAMLKAMTAIPLGRRVRAPAPATGTSTTTFDCADYAPPLPAELPQGSVVIDTLPGNHPAVRYLVDRRFDVAELARLWNVRHVSGWSQTPAANRIVIPIYRPTRLFDLAGATNPLMLAGWQARFVGEPAPSIPKYLFPSNFQKARVLYGLPEAVRSTGPVYLCEGPTDVWRIGPGAVAPFGKQLSRDQLLLLVHHFSGRPVVVLFDDGASEDAERVFRDLRNARSIGEGDNRVVLGQLPSGREDPADCAREELWQCAAAALNAAVEEVIPRPTEGAQHE